MRAWLKKEIARAPAAWALALVVMASSAAYANSLRSGFHFDDTHSIVGNPYLRDAKYARQYLHRPDMFSALPGHNMYRPAILWTYFANYSTGGYDPLHWRLTAIALHTLTAVGVFLTFLALAARTAGRTDRPGTGGALVAALFFALHPVFSETVNYASARSSLLATMLVVWGFLAHLMAQERREKSAARLALWALSLLLFALALLAKEIAIVFPVLLVWATVVQRRGGYLALLPAFALVALYLYVRQQVLGSAVVDFAAREASRATADPGSGGARPIAWNLFTQARVVCAYLGLLAFPFGLCIHRYVRVSESIFEPQVLLGGAVIVALLVWAWRTRRTRPIASLGIVWFFLALAPTSTIIPLNQVMNEHRLYLPGVGIAMLVGTLFLDPHRRAWWAVPVTAALLCALTLRRNADWADPVRIWQSAVEVSPESGGAWNSLGAQLRRRGDLDGADAAFRRCLDLDPDSWDATFNLGTLYLERGRLSRADRDLVEAERWLDRSLEIRPNATRSRWFRAEVYYQMGRPQKAAATFRSLAGHSPRLYEMTRYPLARLALDRGDTVRARELYREALSRGADPVNAYLGMGRVAEREGNKQAAVLAASKAMELRPHSAAPHIFLARLFRGTPQGVRHLFEAERRGYRPTAAERRSILGDKS